jgi:branched-chain amino acid transport system substrate-binding protein
MPDMSPEAKAFTDAWRASFPDKDPNVNSALGYNCYNIVLDAITRAGSDKPADIAAALAATRDLPTALGKLTLNATHDAELPVGIIQYKDGKRVYLGEVAPAL